MKTIFCETTATIEKNTIILEQIFQEPNKKSKKDIIVLFLNDLKKLIARAEQEKTARITNDSQELSPSENDFLNNINEDLKYLK